MSLLNGAESRYQPLKWNCVNNYTPIVYDEAHPATASLTFVDFPSRSGTWNGCMDHKNVRTDMRNRRCRFRYVPGHYRVKLLKVPSLVSVKRRGEGAVHSPCWFPPCRRYRWETQRCIGSASDTEQRVFGVKILQMSLPVVTLQMPLGILLFSACCCAYSLPTVSWLVQIRSSSKVAAVRPASSHRWGHRLAQPLTALISRYETECP